MRELKEKAGRLKEVQAKLNAIFDEAKGENGQMAIANVKSVTDVEGEIKRLSDEQTALRKDMKALEAIARAQTETEETAEYLNFP